jgi:hypothetical protein
MTDDFFTSQLGIKEIFPTFATFLVGTIAQLVEQRTENPCVAGSTPAGTTTTSATDGGFFVDLLLASILLVAMEVMVVQVIRT